MLAVRVWPWWGVGWYWRRAPTPRQPRSHSSARRRQSARSGAPCHPSGGGASAGLFDGTYGSADDNIDTLSLLVDAVVVLEKAQGW